MSSVTGTNSAAGLCYVSQHLFKFKTQHFCSKKCFLASFTSSSLPSLSISSFKLTVVGSSKRYSRLFCNSSISTPTTNTNYGFYDGPSDVELRLPLGNQDIQTARNVSVDADGTSLIVRVQHDGSFNTLIETNNLFEKIKPSETIWYIDDDELVINLKKQDPDLKWPDIVESWESLTAGSMQLLKGTSIYIVGDSTEINQKVARELAVGLGYTPLDTEELLETFSKQKIDSWVLEEGFDSVAEAESSVLESLSSHVRAVVSTLGGKHGAAGRSDKWQHLYAGLTVWLSQTEAIDEDSAKEEAKRHVRDGNVAYSNADVVVKLQGWDADYAKSVAQASLSALKRLILSDKKLPGNRPAIIARGGFSGILPHSSDIAYRLAQLVSDPDVILYCDVQLTRDSAGICTSDLLLENSTNIADIYQNRSSSYDVNGVRTKGYFPVDFNLSDLSQVTLGQGIYSRSQLFDGNAYQILTVEQVASLKPKGLWLNIQHYLFFTQHKLNMRNYVLSVSKSVVVNFISSPEVGFLQSIKRRFFPKITKLIFRFLGPNDVEPSTKQTYDTLLKNLTFIKSFASGILVPKTYIWPMDNLLYLQPHTSIVLDAHKAGLEVYASEFYSDVPLSYNYSFDPINEYLNFVDNGAFSVDGVLSDFPITPSEAIGCFANLQRNASEKVELLVISKNGASGDYPECTDLAYKKAISDGADVIDCPVQMSNDGIPFCMSSINLANSTNVLRTNYSSLSTTIPDILTGSGIFSFNLTWNQIKSLSPAMSNPYFPLLRNQNLKNKGHFLTLPEFLDLAKNGSLSGVLISIEHAAYLIEHLQLPIIDVVLAAISTAGYDNQTDKKVMIQSTSSSVLMKFKEKSNYERVYKVEEEISDALDSAIKEIKTFATSVVVRKSSIFPDIEEFVTGVTKVVPRLQSAMLPVYVETLSNEFLSQPWDFFSDATVEINSYVNITGVNGVITDFPSTSARYKRNRCLNLGDNTPAYMIPVEPGSLFKLLPSGVTPPAEAPIPTLTVSDVAESPLPSGKTRPTTTGPAPESKGPPRITGCIFLSNLVLLIMVLSLF